MPSLPFLDNSSKRIKQYIRQTYAPPPIFLRAPPFLTADDRAAVIFGVAADGRGTHLDNERAILAVALAANMLITNDGMIRPIKVFITKELHSLLSSV